MLLDPSTSPTVDRFSVAASLIECISYSVCIDKLGKPNVIWQTGSLQNLSLPPLILYLKSNNNAPKISELDITKFETHWNNLISGNNSTIDYRIILSDESTCWVRDTATPIPDSRGDIQEIIGSTQNITSLRNTKAPVTDQSLILQAFEYSNFGIAIWDSKDLLLTYNSKFEEFFYPISSCLEKGLSYSAFIDLAASTNEIYSGTDRDKWSEERKHIHINGGSAEIFFPDGRSIEMIEQHIETSGTITIINDLSAQRRGEKALRQAKELAESASTNKSRFLRAANHDLRQPLATLKILIYSCINEEDEKHRQDLLHAMDISASIMEDILNVLLQVGHLDAGKITPRVTNFQLASLLERIEIQFKHQATEKGLYFHVVPTKVTIVSDSALLERIISNFVANAIRYTDIGKILIGCRRKSNKIRLEIHDTGCGIPEEHLDTIFDEFYQVPKKIKKQKQGLGLGLNIAQRIAKLLDHCIHLKSSLGKGSVFAIDLPLGDVWKSEVGEPEISEAIGGEFSKTKVLIVEDDEILRDSLAELFNRWGVNIRLAESEENVLSILDTEDWTPDLLLVDYRLHAGTTGTQVANSIRKKLDSSLPCIVMTADTDPKIIEYIKSLNFPILIKPLNPPQLRLMMHNLLFEPKSLQETNA